ncbi:MAG: hypothetical protein IPJ41_03955 [Phycisphaerales bacterium]|nr:hypothetical protein [Phycisphaerales bacterium]
MKGVLGWIKSHLVMVVSAIVILASLTTGWIFSSGWNKTIRTKLEANASKAYGDVKNAKVTYVIPSLLPGEQAVTQSRAPNRIVTDFVKAQRAQRVEQASGIVDKVEGFNRDGHSLLATKLLPVPVDASQAVRQTYDFLARMGGDVRTGVKSTYVDLLSSIGAGGPPDPVKLATTIQDLQQRETERMAAEGGGGALNAEQQQQLRKALMDRRIAEAQRRAKEISVYADLSSFDPQGFGPDTAPVPPLDRGLRNSTETPTLAEVYEWNFDYWLVSDLFSAIDHANTPAGGTRANIEHALVKRIEKLSVQSLPIFPKDQNAAYPPPDDTSSSESAAGQDPSVSITGRVSTDAYDVVNARMTLVVDAGRLPDLFRAFADANLFTVIDFDVSEVDTWADLRQGYYYGADPVVRVSLELESIWLRDWTTPMMPEQVKTALGVKTPGSPDEGG